MQKQFYVALTINGKPVPSGAVKSGTEKKCEDTARRLNRIKGQPACKYTVFPCS